ncbi:MAG: DUF1640 domain-containing protein [Desulfovibrionaceae bacterium]|nr:DUF1640 domain-containing protein [Desulfovibrionaceae bacterium]
MATTTFDTLKYSKRLQELGFTREQAEGFAEIQSEIVSEGLATKNDLHTEIQSVRAEIQAVKFDLLKWMIGLAFAQMALMTGLLAFLK